MAQDDRPTKEDDVHASKVEGGYRANTGLEVISSIISVCAALASVVLLATRFGADWRVLVLACMLLLIAGVAPLYVVRKFARDRVISEAIETLDRENIRAREQILEIQQHAEAVMQKQREIFVSDISERTAHWNAEILKQRETFVADISARAAYWDAEFKRLANVRSQELESQAELLARMAEQTQELAARIGEIETIAGTVGSLFDGLRTLTEPSAALYAGEGPTVLPDKARVGTQADQSAILETLADRDAMALREAIVHTQTVTRGQPSNPCEYRVWFGTDRRLVKDGDFSAGFSDEYSDTLRCGSCVVYVPKSHDFASTGSPFLARYSRESLGSQQMSP